VTGTRGYTARAGSLGRSAESALQQPTVSGLGIASRNAGPNPRVCPVCGDSLPPAKPRGRKPVFCSTTCRQRATMRRRRAAGLLEAALRHDERAVDVREGRLSGVGSAAYLEGRASHLRSIAEKELRGVPL
jgi:predicted nucleic acid-binding Zn ribbon protein